MLIYISHNLQMLHTMGICYGCPDVKSYLIAILMINVADLCRRSKEHFRLYIIPFPLPAISKQWMILSHVHGQLVWLRS